MPLVNRKNKEFNRKLDEIQKKLDHLQGLALVDGDIAAFSVSEVKELVQGLQEENTIQEVLSGISEIRKIIDQQGEILHHIASIISKMYQDGEINKDTFNKLDEFLKPYYDNSNLLEG